MNHYRATTRAILFGVLILLAFGLYLALSSPAGLVISAQGEINGIPNVARARLQGDRFWTEQLNEARSAFEWGQAAPERVAALNTRLAALQERSDKSMKEFYERNPKAMPSAAEQKAEALRDEADRIEEDELEQRVEKRRLVRIAELQNVVRFLEARNQQSRRK